MGRSSPEGSQERPQPSPPTPSPTSAVTGCSGPKYSEIVGLKPHSSVVSPRPRVAQCHRICPTQLPSWSLGGPGGITPPGSPQGLGTEAGPRLPHAPSSFSWTGPDGFLPCAKSPASPHSW
ncbi:hypothetical protein HJG60_012181 [Phyllostomus discolor]|uniref:Uncharacterized protein n=1 Tax=Phyllostomus discolor TaxID=89673 RepID=A0A833ZDR9_9CHIR|nr:hypothetical protein HJG60_012181 [Phyllostomus discolor]